MAATRLLVATSDSVAVVSGSEAEGWTADARLAGSGAQCIAADPAQPSTVYAGSASAGVLRSDDAGETWSPTSPLGPDGAPGAVFSLAVSRAWRSDGAGVLLAGTEPSALFVSEDRGERWRECRALRSIPSAPTWSFPPRPWTSHVRWIAPSPHDPALLLVGIELGGVMRSTDGGETWADHRPDAYRDCHSLAFHPIARGRAYEAAGGGAALSLDGGETWTPADDGQTRHYVWALAVDPADPDTWYVSASPSAGHAHHRPGQADSVIYRRRGDAPWEELRRAGLPAPSETLVAALAADPGAAGRLFAGLRSGALYESRDYGESWQKLPVRLDGIAALAVVS